MERNDEDVYEECTCGCREAGFSLEGLGVAMAMATGGPGADQWLSFEAPWRVHAPGR